MKPPLRDWWVEIVESGRSGQVIYCESAGRIEGYWEFGGGDTVATIDMHDAATWDRHHRWAAGRRAEILRRIGQEVIRLRAPNCRADIDVATGWIHLEPTAVPPALHHPPGPDFQRVSSAKGKIVFIATLVLLAGVVLVGGLRKAMMIRVPHGVPAGESVRTPDSVATLIQTLEPYVPTLQGRAGKERYQISLFLSPLEGKEPGRKIRLAQHLSAQDSQWAKLLGGDGQHVWFVLSDVGGVSPATGRRIGLEDLKAANPDLRVSWEDSRMFSFGRLLQVTLTDRTVLEFDPGSLKASPVPKERLTKEWQGTPTMEIYLCAGVHPTPDGWLGLHSEEEVASDYKTGSRISGSNRQESAKVTRRLHRGQLGPALSHGFREMLSLSPVSEETYFNAAFLRSGPNQAPLTLPDGAGYLMVYTSAPGLAGRLVAARVDPAGKVAWSTDTGIDRFLWKQVLPDPRHVVFIGPRPAVPNKTPEPILVIVDTQTGAATTHSLWQ